MKSLLTSCFAILLLLPATAQDKDRRPYQVKNLAGENIQFAHLETSGGNLSVTGTDADQRLEVYVWPANGRNKNISDAEIKERLERDFNLTITVSNGKLEAIAKPKRNIRNWNETVSISFKLYAPRQVSTDLTTSGGNISLDGIRGGKQDLETSGGNLSLNGVSSNIKGVTSGGNISVTDCENEIRLSTSGGNISADKSKGTLKLTTSGGNLQLTNLDGKIDAVTSGGNVKADQIMGELITSTSGGNLRLGNLRCSVQASTSGGHIAVSVTELGKYVKLGNSGGDIDLELPAGKGLDLQLQAEKISTPTLQNFQGSVDEHSIRGKVNGGGTPVELHTSSGRIRFTMK